MYVLLVALYHLFLTVPWTIYYYLLNALLEPKTILSIPCYKQKVVLFLHGRNGNCGPLVPLINNINKISPDLICKIVSIGNMSNTSLFTDINNLRKVLEIYVDCEISLVGLSKGGLVILGYITTCNDPRIKKVITISSPIQGTKLASIFPKHYLIYKELSYQSDVIMDILKKPVMIPLYHIVPKYDHLIIPNTSAQHPMTAKDHIYRYNGMYGHIGITHSKEVTKIINQWLQHKE